MDSGSDTNRLAYKEEERVVRLLNTRRVPDWLIGPCWSVEPNGIDDQQGIDAFVGTTVGLIPLQIKLVGRKAGKRGKDRHFYYEKGIGFVTTKWGCFERFKNDDELFSETLEEIQQIFNNLVNLIKVCYCSFTPTNDCWVTRRK